MKFLNRVVLFSLMCLTASVSAADEKKGFEVGVGLGKFFYDNSLIDAASMQVLSIGYQYNDDWQVELIYGNPDSTYGPNQGTLDVDWGALRGMYFLDDWGSSSPYISAGYESKDVLSGENDLVVGIGVKAITDSNIFFRIEGNYHPNDEDTSILAMIGYQFGDDSPRMEEPGDADMDGVPDNLDACPKTAPGTKVDDRGCMIVEKAPEPVQEKDTDGDGVLDSKDKCPATPAGALVDTDGCQRELDKEVSVDLKINFDTNKSDVKAQYDSELQQVADFMTQYAGTQVTIEGHTDSMGRAEYNQALSERRANAVAEALAARFGIDASRITAVGHGEEKPVASNETAEGRAANRRVVAVIKQKIKEKQWTN